MKRKPQSMALASSNRFLPQIIVTDRGRSLFFCILREKKKFFEKMGNKQCTEKGFWPEQVFFPSFFPVWSFCGWCMVWLMIASRRVRKNRPLGPESIRLSGTIFSNLLHRSTDASDSWAFLCSHALRGLSSLAPIPLGPWRVCLWCQNGHHRDSDLLFHPDHCGFYHWEVSGVVWSSLCLMIITVYFSQVPGHLPSTSHST